MENNKYESFIKLLNFNSNKYATEKIFKDFISLFAISLSNKVMSNEENVEMYEKIYNNYNKEEQCHFSLLASELTKIFCNEKEPNDVLGRIYKEIKSTNYLKLIEKNNKTQTQKIEKKLQNIININNKTNNGKMVENDCGTGARILAYASILKLFKIDYKNNLQVTAIDTDIINVFMTYIQMYFFDIAATVILIDKKSNKDIMRLYTPMYEDEEQNLMIA